jgi:hypothetical protein
MLMPRRITAFFLLLILSMTAGADCIQSAKLETVCGKGSCELDSKGRAFCSKYRDGVAISDEYGAVSCGKGQCVSNASGAIRCSSVAGGWATVDAYDKFKCEGKCVSPSLKHCSGK